jgi:hypothetical protein
LSAALQQATAERMAREEAAQANPGTLADAWTEQRPRDHIVEHRRAFYAGALTALDLIRSGVPREQLLAECVQFGRAVGTAAERAVS